MISTGAKFNQRQGAEVDLWAAGCLEVHLVLGGQSQVVVTSSLDAQYSTWYLGTLWTRYLVPVIKFENAWTEAQDIFKGCQNHKRCWVLVSVCNYTNPPKGPQGKGA